jgi:uncharacterized Zn-binding protein involved in type VI secretion
MGKPAARVGDMHVCPMVTPGVPPIPHVGGPVLPPGCPTVLIGGMPAAGMGDMCTCTGPPDSIILGSMGVMIGGKPAARMGDLTIHGGTIVAGCPTVLIGDVAAGSPPSPVAMDMTMATLSQMNPIDAANAAQIIALNESSEDGDFFCEECNKED